MLTDLQDLWLTSRRGALPKANEVPKINVAKTCDRLRLAITQPRNELQRNLDITHRNELKELTFRTVSCLCYTTLRVHEMQVNDLLSRSKMLVAQSGSWSSVQLPSKRNSSQNTGSCQIRRKRQKSIVHSTKSISFTDYTELLDETQNFVEWSKSAEVVDKRISNITQTNNGTKTTCIHIREITINEVDTHNEHYATDDDEGFGNATADELNTIMRMMEEEPRAEAKGTKRKMIESTSVREKRTKLSKAPIHENTMGIPEDSEIEVARTFDGNHNYADGHFSPVRECNSTINEGELNTVKSEVVTGDDENENPCDLNLRSSEINNGYENENICSASPEDGEIEVARRFAGNDNYADEHFSPARECNSNINEGSQLNAIKTEVITRDDENENSVDLNLSSTEINNSYDNQNQCSAPNTSKRRKQSKSKSKVTIDERIQLTAAESRKQIQIQVNLKAKISKMRAKIKINGKTQYTQSAKYYGRILPAANTLLSTLNRSCIPLRKFKLNKPTSDISTMGSNYRNFLRQILNCEITDELADQIYENSNRVQKRIPQRLPSPVLENISTPPLENDCNQNSLVLNNNELENAFLNNNDNLERVGENASTTNDHDDYGTFGIMVKLLNLWRTKNVGDEMPVEYILKPQMLRKQAAKVFYALLKLASQSFIVLVRGSQSAQLKGIQLGPASAKLIQKSERNGLNLKRRHNGYRIHAN